jgi:hypothetical protein
MLPTYHVLKLREKPFLMLLVDPFVYEPLILASDFVFLLSLPVSILMTVQYAFLEIKELILYHTTDFSWIQIIAEKNLNIRHKG